MAWPPLSLPLPQHSFVKLLSKSRNGNTHSLLYRGLVNRSEMKWTRAPGAFSQYGLHARLAFFIHLPILPYPPVNPIRSLEFLHYCPYSMKEDTGTFFRRAYRARAPVLSIAQLLFAGAASKRYGS
ncbi:hypothetical protein NPIL_162531 [Nephila pilipes]|uniref:Uncharacterized protein n=1 Tax=Nephila pilipes TaxID=299642 RepID=A0A8X6PD04_NEPPI|nr:hypothetical protein NPIL_162531 [Nephila pilipes]